MVCLGIFGAFLGYLYILAQISLYPKNNYLHHPYHLQHLLSLVSTDHP